MTMVMTVRKISSGFPGCWARLIYFVAFPHQVGIIHLTCVRGLQHGDGKYVEQAWRLPFQPNSDPAPVLQATSCCCSVAQSCPTLCDPMDCSPPGPSVHGISRQEHWSELPFTSPGDLPDPGTEPVSPALAGGLLMTEPPGKPLQPLDFRSNPHGGASNTLPFTAQHRLPGLCSRLLPVSPPSDFMTFFFSFYGLIFHGPLDSTLWTLSATLNAILPPGPHFLLDG